MKGIDELLRTNDREHQEEKKRGVRDGSEGLLMGRKIAWLNKATRQGIMKALQL